MNEKWFDKCSVVAYPHEIRFLNIDGGSISYCVDRNVSEYINKLQNKIKDIEQENRDKDIKNMILQSKIDKAIELGDKIIQEYEELVGLTGNLVLNFKQVLDVLKENK